MSIIVGFLSNLILTSTEVVSWHNISNTKYNYKDNKNYFLVLLLTICTYINYSYGNKFIKGLLMMIIAVVFCKLILKKNIRSTLILSFIGQLIIIFSEALFAGILVLIFNNKLDIITSSMYYSILFDILISIIIVLISRLKLLNKMYKWLLLLTSNITINQLIIFILFITLGSSIFGASIYFKNNLILTLTLNIIISLLYTVIVILVLNYQTKYRQINLKYHTSLEDLYAQEKLLNDYRLLNHENKNNLLTLKEITTNKQAIKFINSLLKQKEELKDNIIADSFKIPANGLRGLIYNKLSVMKELNIDYSLIIDKKVSSKSFKFITDDDIVDMCQILGVFLDNSIEEIKNYKEKNIILQFSIINNQLSIKIINNKYHSIVSDKSKKTFKSTKGKGRGYGLQLVKRIVDNNPKMTNKTIITKDTFSQELIVILNK